MSALLAAELRLISLPLVRPFRTSFGEDTTKEAILVRVETSDGYGWGECGASPDPSYSEEFNAAAWLVLRDHLIPPLFARDVTAGGVARALSRVRGHRMAKAALEMAVLDAELRAQGRSLAERLGAVRDRVECGVSVGITPTLPELLEQVAGYVSAGYRRVKLKIEPGLDVERVTAVRLAHPGVPVSVDANAAYTLYDVKVFRELDELGLTMIEQPLGDDDIVDHARLQPQLQTPICLDESIRSAADARAALDLQACRVINVKPGRVGGLLEGVRIHDVARKRNVPVWCGGMLETGVGRAANLAIAALPGFTMPGDTSASDRYFTEDLTEPFVMGPDGTIAVPTGPGLGVEPLPERLAATTRRRERVEKE